jgi:hypothetical protein
MGIEPEKCWVYGVEELKDQPFYGNMGDDMDYHDCQCNQM